MSVGKQSRLGIPFECDACGEELQTEEHDFRDAVNMIQREGWAVRKYGNEWTHTCPDCLASETN